MSQNEIAIQFFGILAIVKYSDRVEVLIPNSEQISVHLDGVSAFPHYAWLTDRRPGSSGVYGIRESLAGADVSISAGEGCPANIKSLEGGALFSMDPLRRKCQKPRQVKLPAPRNRMTRGNAKFLMGRITLTGGRFEMEARIAPAEKAGTRRRKDRGGYVLRMGDGSNPQGPLVPAIPVWRTEAKENGLAVQMKLANGARRKVVLPPGGEYSISNLDSRTPEGFDITQRGLRNQLEDGDFRWYYHLFGDPLSRWSPLRLVPQDGNRPAILGPLPVPTILVEPGEPLSAEDILSVGTECQSLFMTMP